MRKEKQEEINKVLKTISLVFCFFTVFYFQLLKELQLKTTVDGTFFCFMIDHKIDNFFDATLAILCIILDIKTVNNSMLISVDGEFYLVT